MTEQSEDKGFILYFGKHKGLGLREKDSNGEYLVPSSYLEWIEKKFDPGKVRSECHAALTEREYGEEEKDELEEEPPF